MPDPDISKNPFVVRAVIDEERQRTPAPVNPDDGPTDSGDSDVMTAAEVAAYLRLKPSTVADLARRGTLPSIKLGRHRRYLRSDVLAFIEEQRDAGR